MSSKMGRPKAENPKSTQISVRLDNETVNKLDEVATVNSETRVQTIRRGIEELHDKLKK